MPQAAILGITLALAAVSTGVAIQGQQQQKKAAKAAAKFNAKVLENEAIKEEQEAREEASRTRISGKKLKARQRVAIAKAGVTEEGSPLLSMAETATNIELAIADDQRASQIQQDVLRGKAGLERFAGASQVQALRFKQGATLLSGASRAAGTFGRAKA